ncbi:hypothetical protein C7441_11467 [Pseudaminobacter salicylatoxidans]|uniref:Uncharacterized protein n=1 Tax=Pseudaminobacter salicylatoxidans TaxID=93369 RepID=A0A316BYP3_PSESE|nr:hypothetical protein [Pseudaminobacter salicylatoxidans]PWJ79790.1 hypothetical protein C7441_11467 [Pseudaminobacter salicylatoxidans]
MSTNERERIGAIMRTEAARRLPRLAAALSYESDVAPEQAVAIMRAAEADVAAATANAEPPLAPRTYPAAGALGLGTPDPLDKPSASAGWGRAVASANRRIGGNQADN